ncbi:MAG: hypothetical protein OXE87_01725 [Chloroflexi bacterium]|nr:hypothetical protein [Chloroflexota bacterium]
MVFAVFPIEPAVIGEGLCRNKMRGIDLKSGITEGTQLFEIW